MTKEQLAALLNGSEYGNEVSEVERKDAAAAGLVIVYGTSDDLLEFDGAIYDEAAAWNGVTVRVINADLLRSWESICDDGDEAECERYFKDKARSKEIKAIWHDSEGEYAWTLETDIPHATFDIMEDGEKFSRGIVFSLSDL